MAGKPIKARFHINRCTCGARFNIVDSRPRRSGIIYRRKVCPACGLKISTVEVPDWYLDMIETNEEKLNE